MSVRTATILNLEGEGTKNQARLGNIYMYPIIFSRNPAIVILNSGVLALLERTSKNPEPGDLCARISAQNYVSQEPTAGGNKRGVWDPYARFFWRSMQEQGRRRNTGYDLRKKCGELR